MTTRRVAVIAVHGVADQKPNASSAAIAALLGTLGRKWREADQPPRYTAFTATELQIPLEPVYVSPEGKAVAPEPKRPMAVKFLAEQRQYLSRAQHASPAELEQQEVEPLRPPPDRAGALAHEFMRMQLEGYRGDGSDRAYPTRRLEGRREAREPGDVPPGAPDADERRGAPPGGGASTPPSSPNAGQREVHVYEVHWADLSRLGSGPLAFIGAVYQILLHLATLGRQAVDDAAAEVSRGPGGSAAHYLNNAQRWAVRALTLPIPLLNVIMFGASLAALPAARLTPAAAKWVGVLGTAAISAWGAYVMGRRRVPRSPTTWALLPVATAGIAGGVAYLLIPETLGHVALGIVWWLAVGLLTWWVVSAYEPYRRGAKAVGMTAYALAFLFFLVTLAVATNFAWTDGQRLEVATLWTTQFIFLGLRASWAVVFVLALVAFVLGIVAVRRVQDPPTRARVRAAVRTGRLAIALSAGAFLFVTIALWSGLFAYGRDKLHVFECIRPSVWPNVTVLHTPASVVKLVPPHANAEDFQHRTERCAMAAQEKSTVLTAAAARTDGPPPSVSVGGDASKADVGAVPPGEGEQTVQDYLRALLVLSVTSGAPVALAIAGVAFFLLLWMAIPSIRAETQAPIYCTNDQSRRMGRWLSRGLDSTAWVTLLLWIAVFGVPLVFSVVDRRRQQDVLLPLEPVLQWLTNATAAMLSQAGAMIAGSAVLIIAIVVKVGGSALDVMLDVDNYLRATPANATPRARITERYVSLLRHVAAEQPDGRRYDAVVIVAHSLGALITVDLLRFLERERQRGGGDAALAPLGFGPPSHPARATIPIHLFTMGNPLRQLLNRFFPHRYKWVRAIPDNGEEPFAEGSDAPPVRSSSDPNPIHLGVARWESAYRSGDYVGRSMWLYEWYNRNASGADAGTYPQKPLVFWDVVRRGGREVIYSEMCIGLGAHTHYWDDSAPDVAERLDYLIATA
ncbi:MAG: hypothetical protein WD801_00630 [Gemmatimonadaceae bacterium]